MKTLVIASIYTCCRPLFRPRRSLQFGPEYSLQFEIVALRYQFNVYQRTVKRPRIGPGDRVLLFLVRTPMFGVKEFSGVCPDWDSDCLAAEAFSRSLGQIEQAWQAR